MATEKGLIDAYKLEALVRRNKASYHNKDDVIAAIAGQPSVDAVEVVYCDECKSHGSCIPEDTFRWMRIEKPYCCVGKRKTNTNCGAMMDGDGNG